MDVLSLIIHFGLNQCHLCWYNKSSVASAVAVYIMAKLIRAWISWASVCTYRK